MMKLSIPSWTQSWTKALRTWGERILGNRENHSQSQPTRLHAERMEDRQLLSTAVSLDWLDTTITDYHTRETVHLPSPEPAANSADLADYFQQLLDGPSRIVDLGGQTWIVPTRITISTMHSGKVIQNGTIKFTFEGDVPRMGGMEIVQGRKWYNADGRTVLYPEGDIDLTLRNLVFDGDFPYDFGLQEHTEAQAEQMNKGYNLITTITRAANNINLSNVHFQNSGNSAIAGSFRTFIAQDISADRVAKHVIGLRGFGGVKAHINRLVVTNSGNVIDFHNEGSFYDEAHPDRAVVRNLHAKNIRGRSKVAGNNWSIDGMNWWFEQDKLVNLNLYPAFDLSKNPRRFVVDGFVAINFPAMAIGTLADDRTGGVIRLKNLYVRDSLAAIKVQQQLSVVDSEFEGSVQAFRSSTPYFQSNNTINELQNDAAWANTYDQINSLFATKNAEWGTSYCPNYWAPVSVRTLMD